MIISAALDVAVVKKDGAQVKNGLELWVFSNYFREMT
jgi:hypothetical protein